MTGRSSFGLVGSVDLAAVARTGYVAASAPAFVGLPFSGRTDTGKALDAVDVFPVASGDSQLGTTVERWKMLAGRPSPRLAPGGSDRELRARGAARAARREPARPALLPGRPVRVGRGEPAREPGAAHRGPRPAPARQRPISPMARACSSRSSGSRRRRSSSRRCSPISHRSSTSRRRSRTATRTDRRQPAQLLPAPARAQPQGVRARGRADGGRATGVVRQHARESEREGAEIDPGRSAGARDRRGVGRRSPER